MTRTMRYLRYVVLGETTHPRAPRKKARRGPPRSWKYRWWIRTLPCLICGGKAEAAHTGSDGGTSMKASDYSCVPLCHGCHQSATGAYHQTCREAFEQKHGISFVAIVRELNRYWFECAGEVK